MGQQNLFEDLPKFPTKGIRLKPLQRPIWTENKAKLVSKYLYYFVLITKHGAYIDGFAGPKKKGLEDSWAAKLVMKSEPPFLRDFFLCDSDAGQVRELQSLIDEQPRIKGRKIRLLSGDFNTSIDEILSSGVITPKKATFCLIDQYSTECHWETVEKIARHKKENKIEIFYFLASGWISRALKGFSKNKHVPEKWWGRKDWDSLAAIKPFERAEIFCKRFREELGYEHAVAWPIYNREGGSRIMFHMIHATDHPEGPKLMWRAYHKATVVNDPWIQEKLPLDEVQSIANAYAKVK